MSAYLETLRSGSEFHNVSITSDGFTIAAINDSPDCMERFNEIVDEAIRNASAGDYEISPHRSSRDPSGRWDFAAITIR